MEVVKLSSAQVLHVPITSVEKPQFRKPKIVSFPSNPITPSSSFSSSIQKTILKSKLYTTLSSSTIPTETGVENESEEEKFDWYAQWYPIMPVIDLDKRVPHAKKVMGIDVVVWWDRNESAWKVFDDSCPHRLAPLSEGRIDQWGRLQCVYHGWCFGGSGDCKFIPQAPPDGPPVHTSKKACVAVYPSTVQNDMVWFWPNTDPQYKDILLKKQPPFIPELDDPSYIKPMGNRDMEYGYELLIENLMDPAHVPYSHYGIMNIPNAKKRDKADREGGRPLELRVTKLDVNGFTGKQEWGNNKFIAPCIFYASPNPVGDQENAEHQGNGSVASSGNNKVSSASQRRALLIFICVPVSPGKSRLIWAFPRNFGKLINQILPRWYFHVGQNLILDSDTYLLHLEERKLMEAGPLNWHKACYIPTSSDAVVTGFRRWFNKYSNGQVDWGGKFTGALPPTPPREKLLDRYWTHVVNCSSCSVAYKGLNALEVVLQIVSVALIAIVAATKHQAFMSTPARTAFISMAILCFAASRWLSHFIYKTFHFHDYNHALL